MKEREGGYRDGNGGLDDGCWLRYAVEGGCDGLWWVFERWTRVREVADGGGLR